jgi:uncharacterized protein (TIGR03643 family)
MTSSTCQIPVDEVIAMAWCDKTSFDDIQEVAGLSEKEVIILMRQNLKPSSFRLWRKRVTNRPMKHRSLVKQPTRDR